LLFIKEKVGSGSTNKQTSNIKEQQLSFLALGCPFMYVTAACSIWMCKDLCPAAGWQLFTTNSFILGQDKLTKAETVA
jgi:hypothetical protein